MKYLGVKIDENLNWKDQTYDIVTELNRPNVLLYKIRNYFSFNIYFERNLLCIFDSHINYANFIWRQNRNFMFYFFTKIVTLQKKTLRIVNNHPRNSHSGPLFKKSNILKFEDEILISNIYI